MRLSSHVLVPFALLAACTSQPEPQGDLGPSTIEAVPHKLAFTCVNPGCDTSQTVELAVRGRRRLVVKRVSLEGDASADLRVEMTEPAPLVVGGGTVIPLSVRHVPAKVLEATDATLVVTYADASSDDSPDRVPAGEIRIPVRRRLVGESILQLAETHLDLGYAPVGRQVVGALHVSNAGSGNMPMLLGAPESDSAMVSASVEGLPALLPGASSELPVRFLPTSELHIVSTVTLPTAGATDQQAVVTVEGTSIPEPRLVVESAGATLAAGASIDLGEVPQGSTRTMSLKLANHGGAPARLQRLVVTGGAGNLSASLEGAMPALLLPLERRTMTLRLNALSAGTINAWVCVEGEFTGAPSACVQVGATVTNPVPATDLPRVNIGSLARGWVRASPVRIRNAGVGTLTIRRIALSTGSSQFFTLKGIPTSPIKLGAQESTSVTIEFRAGSDGVYSADLVVETDSPTVPNLTVTATARVAACSNVCSFAHGVARCDTGSCQLDRCQDNFFNVDGNASTGCECAEPGSDTGDFCVESTELPTLSDVRKGQATAGGIIPTTGDADFFRFFASDDWNLFGDDFVVKVSVDAGDPGIRFCVYRQFADAATNECLLENEHCLTTDRVYVAQGGQGSEDESEFYVKVFRQDGSRPTCGGYTLHVSNGR